MSLKMKLATENGRTLVQFCEKKESDIYHYAADEDNPFGWRKTHCGREGDLFGLNEAEKSSMRLCRVCAKHEAL